MFDYENGALFLYLILYVLHRILVSDNVFIKQTPSDTLTCWEKKILFLTKSRIRDTICNLK